jgi:hypothetical protein
VPLFGDIKDEDNVVRRSQVRFFARWRHACATSKVQRDNKKSWLRSERCPPVAHELNNPSAVAQRIAVHLGEVIQAIQSVAHRLHHALEPDHWDRLIALAGEALENVLASRHNQSVEQSDSEDALGVWLRENGVAAAWKIAPVLVSARVERKALASLREDLPPSAFGDAVRWIALRLTIRALLDDAEQCTGRIANLVDAVRPSARQEARKSRTSMFMNKSRARSRFLITSSRMFASPGIFRTTAAACAAIRANSRKCE